MRSPLRRLASTTTVALALAVVTAWKPARAEPPAQASAHESAHASKAGPRTVAASRHGNVRLDHSGHKRVGMASYYSHRFSGRRMADGTAMRPDSDAAASPTLPLGTKVQVRNLRDGSTAVVTIRDRGPYAKGRIIDLSPRTARQLGLLKAGVARVEVIPMTIPQPDGTIKSIVAMSVPERAEPEELPRRDPPFAR